MIDNKIDELFQAITDSKEYQSYLKIGEVLASDEEINELINKIKELQKKSVSLEEQGNDEYKILDKEIEVMVEELNKKPLYQEYLRRMNNFNDILASSSNNIEQYINEKI